MGIYTLLLQNSYFNLLFIIPIKPCSVRHRHRRRRHALSFPFISIPKHNSISFLVVCYIAITLPLKWQIHTRRSNRVDDFHWNSNEILNGLLTHAVICFSVKHVTAISNFQTIFQLSTIKIAKITLNAVKWNNNTNRMNNFTSACILWIVL